jgi:hypothetical protein
MNTSNEVTGSFNYSSTELLTIVNESPHLLVDPVVELLEDYRVEYKQTNPSSNGTSCKKHEESFIEWVRSDPAKFQSVTSVYNDFKAFEKTLTKVVPVVVKNGRDLKNKNSASLHTTGFSLCNQVSAVTDWDDEQDVTLTYHSEMAAFVKAYTGAMLAFCNDHTIRRTYESQTMPVQRTAKVGPEQADDVEAEEEDPLGLSMKNPLPAVHNDFTESYASELAKALDANHDEPYISVGDDNKSVERQDTKHKESLASFGLIDQLRSAGVTGYDLRFKYRVLVVNAWRNVSDEPLKTMPLAVCDMRSVGASGELVNIKSKIMGGFLETVTATDSGASAHQWYWYPDMTKDEVLLFKTFDSENSGSRGQLHCAFQPKPYPQKAALAQAEKLTLPPRHSCETRVLCLLPRMNPGQTMP